MYQLNGFTICFAISVFSLLFQDCFSKQLSDYFVQFLFFNFIRKVLAFREFVCIVKCIQAFDFFHQYQFINVSMVVSVVG